ncbi:hypothetical protein [Macrococcus equi]|uniref:hypothetical protein n=1 Tax=Macrococcus equi TaxID=3395462 RepID=UPI0039BE024E
MEHDDIKFIKKIISILNQKQNEYTKEFLLKKEEHFHLRKCQINQVVSGNKDEVSMDYKFHEYIDDYCEGLHFESLKIEGEVLDNRFDSRVKQPQSRLSKLLTYRFEKKEEGSLSINKCLNDLYGCRITMEFDDIEKLFLILKEEFKDYKRIKLIISKKYGYEAIHIYTKGENNYFFPWELQIWSTNKEDGNRKSHAIHKQDYLQWTSDLNKT